MFNKIVLIGRLTKDPEARVTASGIHVVKFRMAVDRTYAKQGEEKKTDFFQVVAWRRLAEICSQYLRKGKLISVDGKVQLNKYEKEGEQREMVEIIAENIQMLTKDTPESVDTFEVATP